MLTIDPELQQRLQKYSYDIVEAIEVIGGTNIQFAHDPEDRPRGGHRDQPAHLALLGAGLQGDRLPHRAASRRKLAGGLTLDEIPYWRDGTLEKYTPSGDYVVVKFARWAFEKFQGVEDKLGTQMRAVGEVMSIGKTYKEAFQKAIRSLETGRYGLGFAKDFNAAAAGRADGRAGASRPASGSSSCTRPCARAPTVDELLRSGPTSSRGSSSR